MIITSWRSCRGRDDNNSKQQGARKIIIVDGGGLVFDDHDLLVVLRLGWRSRCLECSKEK